MSKNEFSLAFNEVLEEKQLSKDIILGAIESAMVSAYRRAVNASTAQHVEAKIDPETGKVMVLDRKSTRLNSSHMSISYAVFCLKKKTPRACCCSPTL